MVSLFRSAIFLLARVMIVRETGGGPTPVWGKQRTGLDFKKKKNGEAQTKIWDNK